jgi:hypothetical protein
MLTAQAQRRLFLEAEALAGRLVAGGVTRTELRYLLNPLFLPPEPWPKRLATARRLLTALPSSWVGKRSNQTPARLFRLQEALRDVLREDAREDELRYLLGWTARLVHTRGRTARHRTEPAAGVRREPGRAGDRRPDGRRPPGQGK